MPHCILFIILTSVHWRQIVKKENKNISIYLDFLHPPSAGTDLDAWLWSPVQYRKIFVGAPRHSARLPGTSLSHRESDSKFSLLLRVTMRTAAERGRRTVRTQPPESAEQNLKMRRFCLRWSTLADRDRALRCIDGGEEEEEEEEEGKTNARSARTWADSRPGAPRFFFAADFWLNPIKGCFFFLSLCENVFQF